MVRDPYAGGALLVRFGPHAIGPSGLPFLSTRNVGTFANGGRSLRSVSSLFANVSSLCASFLLIPSANPPLKFLARLPAFIPEVDQSERKGAQSSKSSSMGV